MKCDECDSCKDVCSDHLPACPAGSHFCVGIKQLDKRSVFVFSRTAQYVLSHINLREMSDRERILAQKEQFSPLVLTATSWFQCVNKKQSLSSFFFSISMYAKFS